MKRIHRKSKKITAAVLAACIAASCASIGSFADNVQEVFGDVDGDGFVTSADALEALRMSLGMDVSDKSGAPSGASRNAADVDGDGDVTSNDALLILRESVGFNVLASYIAKANGNFKSDTDDRPDHSDLSTDTGTDICDPQSYKNIYFNFEHGPVEFTVYDSGAGEYIDLEGDSLGIKDDTLQIKVPMPKDEFGKDMYNSVDIGIKGEYNSTQTQFDEETQAYIFYIAGISSGLTITLAYVSEEEQGTDVPAIEHNIKVVSKGEPVPFSVYSDSQDQSPTGEVYDNYSLTAWKDDYEDGCVEFIKPSEELKLRAIMMHDDAGNEMYDGINIEIDGKYADLSTEIDSDTLDRTFTISGLMSIDLTITLYYGNKIDLDSDQEKDTDTASGTDTDTEITSDNSENDSRLIENGINKFSGQLFKECYENGKNTIISPLSVYIALAMTQNGADGDTHKEFAQLLSEGAVSDEAMNKYFRKYIKTANLGDTLRTSNSYFIIENGLVDMQPGFKDTIESNYFAEVFNGKPDIETENMINDWAKDKTDGMIDSILPPGTLNEHSIAVLLNAICFDAEWRDKYDEYHVGESKFTNYDGQTVNTEFLYGEENSYINGENVTGFIKPYSTEWSSEYFNQTGNGYRENYSFVALLPDEDVSIDDYIASLDDDTIRSLVKGARSVPVDTKMPKFTADSDLSLNDILRKLGIPQAFDKISANLKRLAKHKLDDGNVYIDSVLHKAHIALTEAGTKAAAVTAITVCEADSAPDGPEQRMEVDLDRPFVYVIYDTNNDIPVFIGAQCDLTEDAKAYRERCNEKENLQNVKNQITDDINGFSSDMFKKFSQNNKGKNTVISPLSVYAALAMTNNGSANGTKDEMLGVLSRKPEMISDSSLNTYFKDYMNDLQISDSLKMANSIFVMDRDDVDVKETFIRALKDNYFSEVFNAPANDETVDKINKWCSENTDKMIESILDHGSLDETSLAVILNAICFDAEWDEPYDDADNIRNYAFNNYDGTQTEAKFLCSTEAQYIEDDKAVGFIKKYAYKSPITDLNLSDRYSFAAILPKEGVTIDEYIASMDDDTIRSLINDAWYEPVDTRLPAFKIDSEASLRAMLAALGMPSAFSLPDADFSELAVPKNPNENVYIDDVIHKAHIELDNQGTKAAAVTAVVMKCDVTAFPIEEDPHKQVFLDRPFIYVIYDNAHDIPVFVGTVCDFSDTAK